MKYSLFIYNIIGRTILNWIMLWNIKLLKTYSGHNGFLKQGEIEQFYIFLLSSGIIK